MPAGQVGVTADLFQKGHALGDAEMVPTGEIPALAGRITDLFQGPDQRQGRAKDFQGKKIGLSFKIAHKKAEEKAKIEDQSQGHGQDQNHRKQIFGIAFKGREEVEEGRIAKDLAGDPLGKEDRQQDITDEKKQIKKKVFLSYVSYLMGYDPH